MSIETLEQFKAKQAKELAIHAAKLEKFAAIGEIPGLDPWLIHGGLYGWGHVAYKLKDMSAFIAWAENAFDEGKDELTPALAVRHGSYASVVPEIPERRDWEGAVVEAQGEVSVKYSSYGGFKISVYLKRVKTEISFEIKGHFPTATPIARYSSGFGDRERSRVINWERPKAGIHTYLYTHGDRKTCNTATVMNLDEFKRIFGEAKGE